MFKKKNSINNRLEAPIPEFTEAKKQTKKKKQTVKQQKQAKPKQKKKKEPKTLKQKISLGIGILAVASVCLAAVLLGKPKDDQVVLLPEESTTLSLTNPLLDRLASFQCDDENITVGDNGKVIAEKPGIYEVKISALFRSFSCEIHVPGFKDDNLILSAGYTYQSQAVGTGNDTVKWESSDKGVITVSSNGSIETLKEGEATITGKDNGKKFSTRVQVVGISLDSSIIFSNTEHQVSISDAVKDRVKSWSVDDETIATIDQNGKLKGLSAGDVRVSCDIGNNTPLFLNVTVAGLDKSEVYLKKEESFQLNVTGLSNTNGLHFTSDNTKIATVDDKGAITAKSAGKANITLAGAGQSMSCVVYVMDIDNSYIIPLGSTQKLKMDYLDKDTKYIIEDTAIVSETSGKLTGLTEGQTNMTVESHGKSFDTTLYVAQIQPTSTEVMEGEETSVMITGLPDGISPTWRSEDEKIAKVDGNGNITGVKEGETVIKGTVKGNTFSCKIKVSKGQAADTSEGGTTEGATESSSEAAEETTQTTEKKNR